MNTLGDSTAVAYCIHKARGLSVHRPTLMTFTKTEELQKVGCRIGLEKCRYLYVYKESRQKQ